jgi:hypothetical protein
MTGHSGVWPLFSADVPPRLQGSLRALCNALQRVDSIGLLVQDIVDQMAALAPESLQSASRDISQMLDGRWPWIASADARSFPKRQMSAVPDLGFILIFSHDGFIREAALNAINRPPPSAFHLCAMALRLNDWVMEVRRAAADCASRVLPGTDPRVISESAFVLSAAWRTWQRWGDDERAPLKEALFRPDVADRLADLLMTGIGGKVSRTLHLALLSPALDRHLFRLALGAREPFVRATAVSSVIRGQACWPEGLSWKWIDKYRGDRRRVLTTGKRQLSLRLPRGEAVGHGARDRSAAVRSAALQALIEFPDALSVADTLQIARSLQDDRSRRVRERADFLLRSVG